MSVITSTPGQIQVIKRTGDVAAFDAEKISVAIGKAFLAIMSLIHIFRIPCRVSIKEHSLQENPIHFLDPHQM